MKVVVWIAACVVAGCTLLVVYVLTARYLRKQYGYSHRYPSLQLSLGGEYDERDELAFTTIICEQLNGESVDESCPLSIYFGETPVRVSELTTGFLLSHGYSIVDSDGEDEVLEKNAVFANKYAWFSRVFMHRGNPKKVAVVLMRHGPEHSQLSKDIDISFETSQVPSARFHLPLSETRARELFGPPEHQTKSLKFP